LLQLLIYVITSFNFCQLNSKVKRSILSVPTILHCPKNHNIVPNACCSTTTKPLHKLEVVLCPMPASPQPHKAVTLTGYSTSVRSGPMCAEPQPHCYKPQGLSLTYAALQPPNACGPTNHKVVSITCCSTTTKWHPTHGASHT